MNEIPERMEDVSVEVDNFSLRLEDDSEWDSHQSIPKLTSHSEFMEFKNVNSNVNDPPDLSNLPDNSNLNQLHHGKSVPYYIIFD